MTYAVVGMLLTGIGIVCVLFAYACCIVGGRADDRVERFCKLAHKEFRRKYGKAMDDMDKRHELEARRCDRE